MVFGNKTLYETPAVNAFCHRPGHPTNYVERSIDDSFWIKVYFYITLLIVMYAGNPSVMTYRKEVCEFYRCR